MQPRLVTTSMGSRAAPCWPRCCSTSTRSGSASGAPTRCFWMEPPTRVGTAQPSLWGLPMPAHLRCLRCPIPVTQRSLAPRQAECHGPVHLSLPPQACLWHPSRGGRCSLTKTSCTACLRLWVSSRAIESTPACLLYAHCCSKFCSTPGPPAISLANRPPASLRPRHRACLPPAPCSRSRRPRPVLTGVEAGPAAAAGGAGAVPGTARVGPTRQLWQRSAGGCGQAPAGRGARRRAAGAACWAAVRSGRLPCKANSGGQGTAGGDGSRGGRQSCRGGGSRTLAGRQACACSLHAPALQQPCRRPLKCVKNV